MTAPAPVTDENARCRRALRTAEELFKKMGFRAVTMELVAREADLAKATLYSYFKNKDELYLAVCGRRRCPPYRAENPGAAARCITASPGGIRRI